MHRHTSDRQLSAKQRTGPSRNSRNRCRRSDRCAYHASTQPYCCAAEAAPPLCHSAAQAKAFAELMQPSRSSAQARRRTKNKHLSSQRVPYSSQPGPRGPRGPELACSRLVEALGQKASNQQLLFFSLKVWALAGLGSPTREQLQETPLRFKGDERSFLKVGAFSGNTSAFISSESRRRRARRAK